MLDFTKQEEQERIEQQEELSRTALAQLEDLLAAARTQPVRNMVVNRSQLKDDRNTDADQLYRDAERLAQDLKDGQHRQQDNPEDYVQDPVTPPSDTKPGSRRPTAVLPCFPGPWTAARPPISPSLPTGA